jgi:hypothetical protein
MNQQKRNKTTNKINILDATFTVINQEGNKSCVLRNLYVKQELKRIETK